MCILKHSRSCEVKGMAEVRDVETRRETISGIIGAYERDFATYPDVHSCSSDRYFLGRSFAGLLINTQLSGSETGLHAIWQSKAIRV